jgi:hypothetical protein
MKNNKTIEIIFNPLTALHIGGPGMKGVFGRTTVFAGKKKIQLILK